MCYIVTYLHTSTAVLCAESAFCGAGDDHVTLSVLQYPVCDLHGRCAPRNFSWGGGEAPRLYRSNLCLILKTVFKICCLCCFVCYSCFVVNRVVLRTVCL
jgi:hypothetical protein